MMVLLLCVLVGTIGSVRHFTQQNGSVGANSVFDQVGLPTEFDREIILESTVALREWLKVSLSRIEYAGRPTGYESSMFRSDDDACCDSLQAIKSKENKPP